MAPQEKRKSGAVTIKKYPNRRLYDTGTSAYVTLDDLCNMVKRNIDFVVVDAKTNADLTRATLTQIIFEQELKGYKLLPDSFLRHIISFYDNRLASVLTSYLETTMDSFMKNQEKMQGLSGGVFDQFSPLKQLENISKQNMDIFEQTMSMFNPFMAAAKSTKKEEKPSEDKDKKE